MDSLFGIETEYGIAVEGADATHLVEESREVVKSYAGRFAAPWDYRVEDARSDVRGFRADKLSQDPQDAKFDKPSGAHLSASEDRCDRVLINGARLYNDHGHPEYATPECRDLRALVAHDKAGERIVLECASTRAAQINKHIEIFKNNSDFHGASYGTHESYLMRRDAPWENVVKNLAPFLATRILYAGAGKVSSEERGVKCDYQISQRADFFSVLQSVDTLHNRPLVNTRDEAHGDARLFRRLHVIAGDANMSQYATALRIGATNLVAALIESGWSNPLPLRDAVKAIKSISRDASWKWQIELEDGKTIGAIDVQRAYLDGCRALNLPGSDWVLAEWESTLDTLERDPWQLANRLDWLAKKSLLDDFVDAENLDWKRDAPTLQSIDLAYHNVDPQESLHYALVESGAMETLVSEEEIEAARCEAPASTRAALRGEIVRRFAPSVVAISWGAVTLEENGERFAAPLPENAADYPLLVAKIAAAQSPREVASVLREKE